MSLLNDLNRKLSMEAAESTDKTISASMPDGAQIADLSCNIMPGGVEIYMHCGVPFLELHPLEIEMSGMNLRVSRKYRKL